MAMSANGFEMVGAIVEAEDHRENKASGMPGATQCNAQTLTAPAKARAAPKGTIFGRTR